MKRIALVVLLALINLVSFASAFDLFQWLNAIWNPTSYGCDSSPCSFAINVQLKCGDLGWTSTITDSYTLSNTGRTWFGDGTVPQHVSYSDTCDADRCVYKIPKQWFKDYVYDRQPESCWYTYHDASGNERRFYVSGPSDTGYFTITFNRGQTIKLFEYQCQYKAGFGQGYHKDDSTTATCLNPAGCYYAGVFGVTVTRYKYTWNSKTSVSNTISLNIPPEWTYKSCSVSAGSGFSKCYCSKVSNSQVRVTCYFSDSLKEQAKNTCIGESSTKDVATAHATLSVSYTTCVNECNPGQEKCEGFYFYICEKGADGCYHWSQGQIVKGKCGVECTSDSDCDGGYCSNYKCVYPTTTTVPKTQTTVALKCYSDSEEYDLGARICMENYVVECQKTDSTADWRIVEDCEYLGMICQDGKCVSATPTEVKCMLDGTEYNVGERQCRGDVVIECGPDGNWVDVEDCSVEGKRCDEGMCVSKPSPPPSGPMPPSGAPPTSPTTIAPPPVKPKITTPAIVLIAVAGIAIAAVIAAFTGVI